MPDAERARVEIRVWGTLRDLLGGRESVQVQAGTIREMLDCLAVEYPALKPHIESGVSVSVNGAIHNGSWFKRLEPGQEIVILPRIKGG